MKLVKDVSNAVMLTEFDGLGELVKRYDIQGHDALAQTVRAAISAKKKLTDSEIRLLAAATIYANHGPGRVKPADAEVDEFLAKPENKPLRELARAAAGNKKTPKKGDGSPPADGDGANTPVPERPDAAVAETLDLALKTFCMSGQDALAHAALKAAFNGLDAKLYPPQFAECDRLLLASAQAASAKTAGVSITGLAAAPAHPGVNPATAVAPPELSAETLLRAPHHLNPHLQPIDDEIITAAEQEPFGSLARYTSAHHVTRVLDRFGHVLRRMVPASERAPTWDPNMRSTTADIVRSATRVHLNARLHGYAGRRHVTVLTAVSTYSLFYAPMDLRHGLLRQFPDHRMTVLIYKLRELRGIPWYWMTSALQRSLIDAIGGDTIPDWRTITGCEVDLDGMLRDLRTESAAADAALVDMLAIGAGMLRAGAYEQPLRNGFLDDAILRAQDYVKRCAAVAPSAAMTLEDGYLPRADVERKEAERIAVHRSVVLGSITDYNELMSSNICPSANQAMSASAPAGHTVARTSPGTGSASASTSSHNSASPAPVHPIIAATPEELKAAINGIPYRMLRTVLRDTHPDLLSSAAGQHQGGGGSNHGSQQSRKKSHGSGERGKGHGGGGRGGRGGGHRQRSPDAAGHDAGGPATPANTASKAKKK